jgi:DNA processing protein
MGALDKGTNPAPAATRVPVRPPMEVNGAEPAVALAVASGGPPPASSEPAMAVAPGGPPPAAIDAELAIALNATPAVGRPCLCRLAREAPRWRHLAAPDPRVAAALGVTPGSLAAALGALPGAAPVARRERGRAAELGAKILVLGDAGYPAALYDLALPPPVLYVRGELPPGPAVTLVGSRLTDLYGREVAELFGRELAAAGAVVVSGFARGVDGAAHRGALAAPGGRTVAVLGCGLGVDYPRRHRRLGEEIAARGALLTEFPVGMAPAAWQFPVRNRILAALAQAVVVVRATFRSGSLITARHALELGRDVYAVPGRIFEDRSLGPNALIRDGAHLLQHPRDVLENLRPPLTPAADTVAAAPAAPPGLEGRLLAALPAAEARTAEQLAAAAGAGVERVIAALLALELAGRVRREPGGTYSRRL